VIGALRGVVEATHEGGCILDVNGVGYLVSCSRKTLDRLAAQEGVQKLLVETRVSQDAITLYGFFDAAEREAFRALTQVKTVGPQKALQVLSGLSPAELAQAIATKDKKLVGAAKGVGTATANRIVDEPAMQKWALAPGMGTWTTPGALAAPQSAMPAGGVAADAASALVNLGIKRPDAERAVAKAMEALGGDATLDALIPRALREVSGR
jgi:Holliday junction DNA helicase RuvA